MKLASLPRGRDGALVVVSGDLTRCRTADGIAPTLQAALDAWDEVAPALHALSGRLDADPDLGEPFDATACAAPLPRAYQWVDGSAYLNHVELVRRARGAELPERLRTEPLLYQGGSDAFLAPCEPIRMQQDEAWGVDFEGEIAVLTGDVPQSADRATAAAAIRLVLLVNDVSLRALIPGELAKGFGFFQSKPSSALSPVAVTPDELGEAWDGGRLHRPLCVDFRGRPFGRPEAGAPMSFDFPALIVHAARTRRLGPGTLVGSGTVSNGEAGGPGRPVADGGVGYACLAEQRMIETIRGGAPTTPFMRFGDRVRIWMDGADGASIFGAIDQRLEPLETARP